MQSTEFLHELSQLVDPGAQHPGLENLSGLRCACQLWGVGGIFCTCQLVGCNLRLHWGGHVASKQQGKPRAVPTQQTRTPMVGLRRPMVGLRRPCRVVHEQLSRSMRIELELSRSCILQVGGDLLCSMLHQVSGKQVSKSIMCIAIVGQGRPHMARTCSQICNEIQFPTECWTQQPLPYGVVEWVA